MVENKKVVDNRLCCDMPYCNKKAKYDSAIRDGGSWMYLCAEHWKKIGCQTKGLYTDLDALAKKRSAKGLN